MSVQTRSTTRRRQPTVEDVVANRVDNVFQLKSGQHAGKFVVKIANGATDPATGALKEKRYGPYADHLKAIAVRDAHFAKVDKHVEVTVGRQAKDMTLADFALNVFLPVTLVNKGNGLNSLSKYRSAFERHILPDLGMGHRALGTYAMSDLTTTIIQVWVRDLSTKVGRPTVNYCLKRLKTCLYAAALDPKTTSISDSPAAGKRVSKLREAKPKSAKYVGSPADLPKLIAAAGDDRLAPLFQFVTDSGLRVSEVAALHWRDINLDGRYLTVNHHTVESGDSKHGDTRVAILPYSKASADAESVALTQAAVEALLQVREQLLRHKLGSASWAKNVGKASEIFYAETPQDTAGQRYVVPQDPISPDALVFPADDGMPSTPAALSSYVDRVAARAGVQKTIHLLRHDCGSFMIRENIPLTVVQKHLRHANLATTVATYAHMLPEDQRLGADALDRLWARQAAQAQAV